MIISEAAHETNDGLAMARSNGIRSGIHVHDLPSVERSSNKRNSGITIDLVNSKSNSDIRKGLEQSLILISTIRATAFIASSIATGAVFLLLTGCSGSKTNPQQMAETGKQYTDALDECIAKGEDAGKREVYTKCANEADIKYGRKGDGGK